MLLKGAKIIATDFCKLPLSTSYWLGAVYLLLPPSNFGPFPLLFPLERRRGNSSPASLLSRKGKEELFLFPQSFPLLHSSSNLSSSFSYAKKSGPCWGGGGRLERVAIRHLRDSPINLDEKEKKMSLCQRIDKIFLGH